MATRTLTGDTFEQVVTGNGMVLVDFWATWCGPCRSFGPIFEAASDKHPDIVFAKVDIDENSSLAAGAGISSVPTLMAFKEGALVYCQPGALPGAALEDVISQLRAQDMEHVRSHLQHDEQKEEPPSHGADRESQWHYHDGAPEPQHQNGS